MILGFLQEGNNELELDLTACSACFCDTHYNVPMSHEFETYRGFIYPWVIDHVGQMNVQSYTARFDEASWHFLAHLG
jgi:hypothetical protein